MTQQIEHNIGQKMKMADLSILFKKIETMAKAGNTINGISYPRQPNGDTIVVVDYITNPNLVLDFGQDVDESPDEHPQS